MHLPRIIVGISLLGVAGCGNITEISHGDGGGSDVGHETAPPADGGGANDTGGGDGRGGDAPIVCAPGFADCDHRPDNGCEADLSAAETCGGCLTKCVEPAPVCSPGGCASGCGGATPTRCGTTCVDTTGNPDHCGGCGTTCPARAGATATCSGSRCAWTCQPTFVDIDGDIGAPRDGMSTGCECRRSGAVDRPDLAFADEDCDGIDGAVAAAVFVSPRGNDSAAGTMSAPKRTLAAAINTAAAASPRRDVYAAVGTYSELVTLSAGVSIFGGYDDARGWTRAAGSSGAATVIDSPAATAVFGSGLAAPLELQLLTIHASGATGTGNSSYGVRIVASPAQVVLRSCTVSAGGGSLGGSGASGSQGPAGGSGATGQTGGPKTAGGVSSCGVAGGFGGPAVTGSQDGLSGASGFGPVPGGGGTGAIGYGVCLQSGSHGNNAPDNAVPGAPGLPGANGLGAVTFGIVSNAGVYVAPVGGDGRPGAPGSGGGGGGSGSGDSSLSGLSCVDAVSGGGGGGGAGGCAGTIGFGGAGGGGSFAVVSVSSNVIIDRCQLSTSRGGDGGPGGNGGPGGAAGFGRGGGPPSGQTAGWGATGKDGGVGGTAGSGAGGTGGPSVCVVYTGSAPAQTQSTCMRGSGGTGGLGGVTNVLGRAPNGPTGVSADAWTTN